jgi:hypothetical protein
MPSKDASVQGLLQCSKALKMLNLLARAAYALYTPCRVQATTTTNQEHTLCCPQHTDNTHHSVACKHILAWAAYTLHMQAADHLFHPFIGPLSCRPHVSAQGSHGLIHIGRHLLQDSDVQDSLLATDNGASIRNCVHVKYLVWPQLVSAHTDTAQ